LVDGKLPDARDRPQLFDVDRSESGRNPGLDHGSRDLPTRAIQDPGWDRVTIVRHRSIQRRECRGAPLSGGSPTAGTEPAKSTSLAESQPTCESTGLLRVNRCR